MKRTGRKLLAMALLLSASSVVSAQVDSPYLLILGVAQDAGYPQAGCLEPHCLPGWEDARRERGATSMALIDPQAGVKFLFEATPHLPRQLYELERQAPRDRFRLGGIFLTHAHIGHYAGLMFLGREAMGSSGVPVYAMPKMRSFLEANGPWSQLVELENIALRTLRHGEPQRVDRIEVTPFLVPHRDEYSETVGFRVEGPQKSAVFIPDINKWSDWDTDIVELIRSVDYALLDATFYADGELGGRDMSQIPHPFVFESMELFAPLTAEERSRVWFIHFNHTNPLLDPESEPSGHVRSAGFNIAMEGVKLPL